MGGRWSTPDAFEGKGYALIAVSVTTTGGETVTYMLNKCSNSRGSLAAGF